MLIVGASQPPLNHFMSSADIVPTRQAFLVSVQMKVEENYGAGEGIHNRSADTEVQGTFGLPRFAQ